MWSWNCQRRWASKEKQPPSGAGPIPSHHLLHWEQWCGTSGYTTLSRSAQLNDCLQYCLTWWCLGRNHTTESEVWREWKHEMSPQSSPLPQSPSCPSAAELPIREHLSRPSWGYRMLYDEIRASSGSMAAGQERGKEGLFFRSELCWLWCGFFHDECLDASMPKERQSWFDRSLLVLQWNSCRSKHFQPCGNLLMLWAVFRMAAILPQACG